jgi:hypothetical protein
MLERLDDEFLINRQFAAKGIEEMLGVDLEDLGYRFHGSSSERRSGMARLRETLLGRGEEAMEEDGQ